MLELIVYVCAGILIMMVGYSLIDLAIPIDFPSEIKNGNKSVGWLSAGIYIGLGMIIKSVVTTLSVNNEKMALLDGIKETVIYAIIGILFFLVSYFIIDLVNVKFNFNEELKNKNEAAGIMIFGIFISIALIISGVIL